jgi:hypothetical protein
LAGGCGDTGGLWFCMKLSMDMDCCETGRSFGRSRCELCRRSCPVRGDDIVFGLRLRGDTVATCGNVGISGDACTRTGDGGTGGVGVALEESFRLRPKNEPLRESTGEGATPSSFLAFGFMSTPSCHGPRDSPRDLLRLLAVVAAAEGAASASRDSVLGWPSGV